MSLALGSEEDDIAVTRAHGLFPALTTVGHFTWSSLQRKYLAEELRFINEVSAHIWREKCDWGDEAIFKNQNTTLVPRVFH